jgi:putative dehydrogenase
MDPDKGVVGIIGLGIMGGAIATNLLKAGFNVIGTDVVADRRAALTGAGGTAVAGAREVGKHCQKILLSLPSEAALNAVCEDLCGACMPGAIVIETSTLPLAAKGSCRTDLARTGVVLLDCTISGTGIQAKNRDLAVYASGDEEAIRQIRPIIDAFARTCHEVGEFGNGTKMKIVANLLVAIHNVAAAEALLLGARLGLDPAQIVKVIGDGAGSSRMLQVRGPVMVNRTWNEAGMKNSLWQKDMKLIHEAVHAAGCPASLFSATIPIYQAAVSRGHADHDTAAIYDVMEAMVRPKNTP